VIVPFSDLPNADVRFDNFKVIGLPDSTVYYSEKPVINSVTGLSPTADELLVDLPEPLWVNQLVK
jgi:hypothetical protein